MRIERIKMTLPVDLVKYVRKKVIRCIGLFVLLECVTVLICIWTWDYFAARVPFAFHIGVIFWINVIPFFVTKFPWALIDKSWCGEVVDVSIEEKVGAYTLANFMGAYSKNIIYLNVKLDNGKHKRIAIQDFGSKINDIGARYDQVSFAVPNAGDVTKHLDDYSIGDRVYHFYGLKHYYVEKKNLALTECVVCGFKNKEENDVCVNCGHSLIKNV